MHTRQTRLQRIITIQLTKEWGLHIFVIDEHLTMAILDLEAMARYGAYAYHFDRLTIPGSPLDEAFSIRFIGGTAEFDSPINTFFDPLNAVKAERLLAYSNAADRGERVDVRVYYRPKDKLITGPKELVFDKSLTRNPLVSVSPDPNVKFQVQTDKAQGAESFTREINRTTQPFVFTPGAKQEFSYKITNGVDLSYTVTEGLSKTTTQGGSSSTTASVELGGSFLGIGASASLERQWSSEWSTSQTIDFSSVKGNTVSKSTEVSTTVDFNSTQANSKGKYFYGNVELIPGKTYQLTVVEEITTLKTPITGAFIIRPTAALNTSINTSYETFGNLRGTTETQRTQTQQDAAESIYKAYKDYNYDSIVQDSLADRSWTFQRNPSRLSMGLTNSAAFSGATNLRIELRPVVTQIEPQEIPTAQQKETTDEYIIDPMIAIGPGEDSREAIVENIFLDNYNTNNGIPGVAFDLADFTNSFKQAYVINGTTEGGDYISLDSQQVTLQNFKDSVIEVNGGFNKFNDGPGNGFNKYFLNGGSNMIYLRSDSNYIDSQGGTSLINIDVATRVDINSGSGSEILKISDSNSEIFSLDWDFKRDRVIFGPSIDLRDVNIEYDSGMGNYEVSIGEKVVAILDAKDDSLPAFDAVTGQYQGTPVQPFAFAAEDAGDFISTLYSAALDRLPSASELMRHESDIQSGATRASVVESILTSSEFITELATDREYVAGVYRTLLGKDPSRSQLRKSVNRLEDGMQRASFVDSVLESNKFADFFGQELPLISVQGLGIF